MGCYCSTKQTDIVKNQELDTISDVIEQKPEIWQNNNEPPKIEQKTIEKQENTPTRHKQMKSKKVNVPKPAVTFRVPEEEYCKIFFDDIDRDEKGFILITELHEVFQFIDISINQSTIEKIMQLINDEKNEQIDFKKFCKYIQIFQNCNDDDYDTILYLAADQDYSNDIDKQEFIIACKKLANIKKKTIKREKIEQEFDKYNKETINYYNFVDSVKALKLN